MISDDALVAELAGIVGAEHLLTDDDLAPYLTDWRGRYRGAARCVPPRRTTPPRQWRPRPPGSRHDSTCAAL